MSRSRITLGDAGTSKTTVVMHSYSNKVHEPHWPTERGLSRYNVFAGFDIREQLKSGGLWIDVGVGKNAKPMRGLLGKRNVTLKAIAPHPRSLPEKIAFTVGSVPEHRGFLRENRGSARLVTDVFGAVSYCDDPVRALIYEGLLLGKTGVCVAFTELRRLGDIEAWDRTTQFFDRQLEQEISYQTVFALGDSSRIYETYLRIRIAGKARRRGSLAKLFEAARDAIGTPHRDKALWSSPDRSADIWGIRYRV